MFFDERKKISAACNIFNSRLLWCFLVFFSKNPPYPEEMFVHLKMG